MNNSHLVLGVLKFLQEELRHDSSIDLAIENTIEELERGIDLFKKGSTLPITFKELREGKLVGKYKKNVRQKSFWYKAITFVSRIVKGFKQ